VPLVSVLATGGTIASRSDPGGAATAQDAGADLVSGSPYPPTSACGCGCGTCCGWAGSG
jgi:L-asparaginase/Glu-tRNA(Gln) amidotransferase subunit D